MIVAALRVASLVTLLGCMAVPVLARKPATGFLDRTLTLNGSIYKYQVFLPENWSSKQKWPIILFLHGAGERGSDGLLQTEVGMPSAVRKDRSRFPAIIVMPQCKLDRWWTELEMQAVALTSLARAAKEFNGDSKRTYLTGLSMGGYGSWAIAEKNPGKFAAVVPICGGIVEPKAVLEKHPERAKTSYPDEAKSYAEIAKRLGKTPIWIFHGEADPIVPVAGSRKMYEALKAAGGNVRYTEYPDVGHDSWDKAYAEPELIAWMLAKSL
ncbi:MAG TPA: prolyl oligopeptidase family serine peptidase [Candidatus Acidoferrum sp.]|nr:prolyl oligopeptidase family serine peptidase [Candidatus Acidoferrum sp.]